MSTQETTQAEQWEREAKALTARMNAVRYIGEQAMWMYGCAHNILKEYEHASNIDQEFQALCAVVKTDAHKKAKACQEYAATIEEKLKRLTDKLAGEE